jgi:hypothetical protein
MQPVNHGAGGGVVRLITLVQRLAEAATVPVGKGLVPNAGRPQQLSSSNRWCQWSCETDRGRERERESESESERGRGGESESERGREKEGESQRDKNRRGVREAERKRKTA